MLHYERDAVNGQNSIGDALLRSTQQSTGFRHDEVFQLSDTGSIEAGAEAVRTGQRAVQWRAWDPVEEIAASRLSTVANYDAQAWRSGGYAQCNMAAFRGSLRATAGGRFDHFSFTGETVWLPRASLSWAITEHIKLSAAYGQYAQFPVLDQSLGAFASPALRALRSTHYDARVDVGLGRGTRLRASFYRREDRHLPFSEETEWRIVEDQTYGPQYGAPLRDSLLSHARGAEISIARSMGRRLAGSIAYSYGHARDEDPVTGLRFDSDFDQRHIINSYAVYQVNKTVSFTTRYRYTTNFPIAGFFREVPSGPGMEFRLAEERNLLRLPAYSRLDLRLDKSFRRGRFDMTFYAEIANLLNHSNMRYTVFDQVPFNKSQVWLIGDTMLPVLPAAGFRVEF